MLIEQTSRLITVGVVTLSLVTIACALVSRQFSGQGLPTRLSNDHDPLFQFHRWRASLRILDVETVQTVLQVS